jgi:HAD superfamily hydrolase (TIGR01490 family)
VETVLRGPTTPPGAAPVRSLAVFDLDRTLVAGSSLARFARALGEDGVLRRRHLAGHLLREAVFAARGLGPAALDRLRTSLLHSATGLEREPLLDVAHRIGPAIAAEVFPGARWLLDRHLADGHEVVVLSSSPQELVSAVAAALDPTIVPVGTWAEVVDGRYTGLLAAPFCHGPGKLLRLEQVLGWRDLDGATAYADSASDLPLLRACGSPVAVNPDRGLRAVAAASRWPLLDLS